MSLHNIISISVFIRRIKLEVFGIFGFVLAAFCYYRMNALERKLNQAGVLSEKINSK